MKQVTLNQSTNNYDSTCGDLMTMAEQELAAFVRAVTGLFGPVQAKLSAEDWLQEVKAIRNLPTSTGQWRLLTVKVAARLASRVNAQSISLAS